MFNINTKFKTKHLVNISISYHDIIILFFLLYFCIHNGLFSREEFC